MTKFTAYLYKEPKNSVSKYKVIVHGKGLLKLKTIKFGYQSMSDYTIHRDKTRQKNYLSRHRKNENWDDIFTAGAWSRWILWHKPSLNDAINDMEKRFNLTIYKKY